jgi:5-methylcytosine-specific restriction protein B
MRDSSWISIGWSKLGNLESLVSQDARGTIATLLQEHYPNTKSVTTRKAGEINAFINGIGEGDIVCASDGETVLGVGRVTGTYKYRAEQAFPHCRDVEWLAVGEWRLREPEGNRTTVWKLRDYSTQLEVETLLSENRSLNAAPIKAQPKGLLAFEGIERRIVEVLDRKRQVILYGPPGTGKTHWGLITARDIAAYRVFERSYSRLTSSQKSIIDSGDLEQPAYVRTCTFHPEFGYEGFIEGYRPELIEHQLSYVLHDGVFKQLCVDAAKKPDLPYFLVIDEINRGDIPRIFGELLTLLEFDKRGQSVLLPISGHPFSVPSNVFLIGTMNTADRSIALLDVALRRRFGFIPLPPDYTLFGKTKIAGLHLGSWLKWVNQQIRQIAGADGRHRAIGHAYLLENGVPITNPERFVAILRDDIVPLLEEYCYEDIASLERILGSVLVDIEDQRVRYEIFESDNNTLIDALLSAGGPSAAADKLDEDDSRRDDDDID